MNPAFSIVVFTVLAGLAQGLVVVLAVAGWSSLAPAESFTMRGLVLAEVLLCGALLSSFLHLGHKLRAWRAVMMWRTSWMSREVIVMPAFIGAVALWWLSLLVGAPPVWRMLAVLLVLVLAAALWLCTAMIYACLRFVQEWAHPLTVANYTAIGLASGLVLAGAVSSVGGEPALAKALLPWALLVTLAAAALRATSLSRNARLRPRSTLQSATGIRADRLVQTSMGMTGGSFNTREFFHGLTLAALRRVKVGFLLFGFALPALLLLAMWVGAPAGLWWLALPLQSVGLVAERWFFFAEARHPQNLYYQTVS